MSEYVVRFQLQSGGSNIGSTVYSENRPCTKSTAKAKLSELQRQVEREYRDGTWERELADAFNKANRAIDQSSSSDAGSTRNFTSPKFTYKDREFRIDVAIERGKGHFSE
jgi:hypothetical protein